MRIYEGNDIRRKDIGRDTDSNIDMEEWLNSLQILSRKDCRRNVNSRSCSHSKTRLFSCTSQPCIKAGALADVPPVFQLVAMCLMFKKCGSVILSKEEVKD